MGWVCFALFFSPRASPRDNSFAPTDVQNSPYQQEKNDTKEELFTAI